MIAGSCALQSAAAPEVRPAASLWLVHAKYEPVKAPRAASALAVLAVCSAPAGIIQQLTPVGALGLGWLVYGDRIPPLSAAGAVLALTGVSWGAWHISRDVLPEDA